jgi:nucleoside-diphosphate-sugar epimerase
VADTNILVTGAGGFIGGAVVRALAAEPDLTVHGATRDGRALGDGILPCRLDVCDAASMTAALRGIDAVVHCAVGKRTTTVEGTQVLLRAARAAGVRRVVHLSSVAVYGGAAGTVDETADVVSPEGRGYANWKAATEAACAEAARSGLDVVILRPAIVYGPGSLFWIILPARRLLSGAWGALGEAGRGTCNPVHVTDVAAACLAAIRAAPANGTEAFNVSGRETLTWSAWYASLAAALGCPALREMSAAAWRRRTLAALPLLALARIVPAVRRIFAARLLIAPARSELTLFALAATYPADKAAARLGWQPRIGLDEGLADAVGWLRSAGLVQSGPARSGPSRPGLAR